MGASVSRQRVRRLRPDDTKQQVLVDETLDVVREQHVEATDTSDTEAENAVEVEETSVAARAVSQNDDVVTVRRVTEVDEIQVLSDGIRAALQCPVCMELSGSISSCCENGHATCDECTHTMALMDPTYSMSQKCPVCRAPSARSCSSGQCHYPGTQAAQPPPPPAARKLYELLSVTKVACSFRSAGCPELAYIPSMAKHEAVCPHGTQVRCLVARCTWIGSYADAFRHVSTDHQYSAYDVTENKFLMPDLTYGLNGTVRRMYLIRNVADSNRLYWVGVSRTGRFSSLVTVMKVMFQEMGSSRSTFDNIRMTFKVKSMNKKGKYQQRGPRRHLCWDRTMLSRSFKAMERGADRETCMTALFTPPWCTATVYNGQQFNVVITWNERPR